MLGRLPGSSWKLTRRRTRHPAGRQLLSAAAPPVRPGVRSAIHCRSLGPRRRFFSSSVCRPGVARAARYVEVASRRRALQARGRRHHLALSCAAWLQHAALSRTPPSGAVGQAARRTRSARRCLRPRLHSNSILRPASCSLARHSASQAFAPLRRLIAGLAVLERVMWVRRLSPSWHVGQAGRQVRAFRLGGYILVRDRRASQ